MKKGDAVQTRRSQTTLQMSWSQMHCPRPCNMAIIFENTLSIVNFMSDHCDGIFIQAISVE